MRLTILALFALVATWAAPVFAEPSHASPGLAYYENPSSLSVVAKRFHLSVEEIARLNHIEDRNHFNAHGLLLPDTPSTRRLPRYVAWTPAPAQETCAVKAWTFHHVTKSACKDAYCASGPAGEEGCLCRDEAGSVTLAITSSQGLSAKIPVTYDLFNPFGASVVDIASVDLDEDGNAETLVSWLTAVSNGIAEDWRSLVVLKDGRELVRYESGEFTATTAAVRVDGRCHLASSHYEEVTHPLRGAALHVVERTFDPFAMRMDRKLVARRFSDTTRFILSFDPLVAGGARSPGQRGTIVRARRQSSGELEAVSFRTSTSKRELKVDQNPEELRLGDARIRRVFPMSLVWKGLVGRAATLEQHAARGTQILWLGK